MGPQRTITSVLSLLLAILITPAFACEGGCAAGYECVWVPEFEDYFCRDIEAGDYATALKKWKPLAEQGNASAQYNLGVMYEKGHGVIQDYAEAMKWYRAAAEQGYALAQYNLGVMYTGVKGVPPDKVAAHMWFNIAAANGNRSAIRARDGFAGRLTPSQFAEAQQRAKRCMSSLYEDCQEK